MKQVDRISGKMIITEMDTQINENKKVWITPQLEVLDGKKTYDGTIPSYVEDEWEDIKDAETES